MTGLVIEALTVAFGRFTALDGVSLAVDPGEVRAVIGPNGAGKTTLLDVISGITKPVSGRVMLGDRIDLTTRSEAEIARAGVRRKFQKPSVFPALTVRENLEIGCGPAVPAGARAARIASVLGEIGLGPRADIMAGRLSHGEKQWLEIGMVLAAEPALLLLDEPVAGFVRCRDRADRRADPRPAAAGPGDPGDRARHELRRGRRRPGDGAARGPHALRGQPARRPERCPRHRGLPRPMTHAATPARLTVEGLDQHYGSAQVLRGIALAVEPGACLTVLGRNGAGKTTLLRCLTGSIPESRGRIALDGTDLTRLSPDRRARAGLAYVPQGARSSRI